MIMTIVLVHSQLLATKEAEVGLTIANSRDTSHEITAIRALNNAETLWTLLGPLYFYLNFRLLLQFLLVFPVLLASKSQMRWFEIALWTHFNSTSNTSKPFSLHRQKFSIITTSRTMFELFLHLRLILYFLIAFQKQLEQLFVFFRLFLHRYEDILA